MKKRGFAAFLLAQVGAQAAKRFAEALEPLGLTPAQAGIFRMLMQSSGLSQRDLAARLGIHPSRLVGILDEMEAAGFVVRAASPEDRRVYSLQLTPKGRDMMAELGRVSYQHNQTLCAALTPDERTELVVLLQKVADSQGLRPGVHPGYSSMGPGKPRGEQS